MKKNMGSVDKTIRTLIALTVLVLYLTGVITGTAAIVFGIIAIVFLVTSFIGFCPLYTLCQLDTCKIPKK
ncbi:MAG: DUF2892 domain-containing protein [bacterium]